MTITLFAASTHSIHRSSVSLFADDLVAILNSCFVFLILGILLLCLVAAIWFYIFGIARLVNSHLGLNWKKATVLNRPLLNWERTNFFLALEALHKATPAARPVYSMSCYNDLITALGAKITRQIPLEYLVCPISLTDNINVVVSGLYLLHPPDFPPFVAAITRTSLGVMAATPKEAQLCLEKVGAEANRRNVFRGGILMVEQAAQTEKPDAPDYLIKFHDLPKVNRDQIILPEEVMQVVERNVIGLLTHAEILRKAGRSTRHGVLFHGPPGVGKTLVAKYLARVCPDYTVILLTGRQIRFVRESCMLARLLQPSLVVIEDVDLIAADREQNFDTILLHDLMDEMDGLGQKADVIFLLTTNRPRILEKALTARPGRVDQAIYFPLPDRDCRRRLFAYLARGLDISAIDLEPVLDRTDGASPAFIEELFRKAALMAAERGEKTDPLCVTTADFDKAIRELVEFGGAVTQHLLGYRSDPDAGNRELGFRDN